MKTLLLGCCFLFLSTVRVESKPQITKLYPVPEEPGEYQERQTMMNAEAKPLDKFLGKLRATYNFVFRKPEDTGNVERILSKDAPNPDIEALKLIWSNQATSPTAENSVDLGNVNGPNFRKDKQLTITSDNWITDSRPSEKLEPLPPLEFEVEDKNLEVETVTPVSRPQLPITLSRHLVDWLGSLLGLTYNAYAKLAQVVHVNNRE